MKAAVEATHQLGKRSAIHSHGPAGARDAVRAGADSLEQAVDVDDETLSEMARRGTFYVPTIDHNRYYIEHGEEYGFTPGYRESSPPSWSATWKRLDARFGQECDWRPARTRSRRCSARTPALKLAITAI